MHARLENLANIRVPVIAAIEGRASVHALLANVIVAGEGAAFNDLPLFAGGIVPATESSPRRVIALAHEGRRRFFSNPQPVSARTAY